MNNLLTKTKLYSLLFQEPNKTFRQLIEDNRAGVMPTFIPRAVASYIFLVEIEKT